MDRSIAPLSSLRAMFSLAKERGLIHEMPTHWPMRQKAKPRSGFFEIADYCRLLASLPADLKPLLAIGFWTGMRVGEIRGLLWSQIDFLNGRLNPAQTKNGEGRSAPMTSELVAILRARYATRPKDFPFVCYRIDQLGRPERVNSFCQAWRNHCAKLGLGRWVPALDPVTGEQMYNPPRGPRSKPKPKVVYEGKLFHDLLRTGVRNLIRAGVPQSVAQIISGHRTASVFRRYGIVDERDVLDPGRKLDRFFGDNSGTISASREDLQNVTN